MPLWHPLNINDPPERNTYHIFCNNCGIAPCEYRHFMYRKPKQHELLRRLHLRTVLSSKFPVYDYLCVMCLQHIND